MISTGLLGSKHMKHIVGICRFSLLGRGDWKAYRKASADQIDGIVAAQREKLFDSERLEERLWSFEHITLASLKAQTDQNFILLVLASSHMPDVYKNRLADICRSYQNVKLKFFDVMTAKKAQISLLKSLEISLSDCIQFRLDDDDGLSDNYIQELRKTAEEAVVNHRAFTVTISHCLYALKQNSSVDFYSWTVNFLAAGIAFYHPRKSIFEAAHFAMGNKYHYGVLPDCWSFVSNNGHNDSSMTEALALKRGLVKLEDVSFRELARKNFSWIKQDLFDKDKNISDMNKGCHYKSRVDDYVIEYIPRSDRTLFVGFDSLADVRNDAVDRKAWGHDFAKANGWSFLGVRALGETWFRSDNLRETLADIALKLKGYERIALSGTSMGGYAACVFSPLFPGCSVIAFSPQSSLCEKIAPWDMRYPQSHKLDWTGRHSDAQASIIKTNEYWIFYDHHHYEDRLHAERLIAAGAKGVRMRWAGHMTAQFLSSLSMLSEVSRRCVNKEFTESWFYERYRMARYHRRYVLPFATELVGKKSARCVDYALQTKIMHQFPLISLEVKKKNDMRKIPGFNASSLHKEIVSSMKWASNNPYKFQKRFKTYQGVNSLKDYDSLYPILRAGGKRLASSADYHVWMTNCLASRKDEEGVLNSLLSAYYIDHRRPRLSARLHSVAKRMGRSDIISLINKFSALERIAD